MLFLILLLLYEVSGASFRRERILMRSITHQLKMLRLLLKINRFTEIGCKNYSSRSRPRNIMHIYLYWSWRYKLFKFVRSLFVLFYLNYLQFFPHFRVKSNRSNPGFSQNKNLVYELEFENGLVTRVFVYTGTRDSFLSTNVCLKDASACFNFVPVNIAIIFTVSTICRGGGAISAPSCLAALFCCYSTYVFIAAWTK